MKQRHRKTRPAAKTPSLRTPTRSELQDKLTEVTHELTEVTRHRAAISEVLRAIASSPHDLQPIFDTIVDSATRLCRADGGTLRLYEEKGLRLVAFRGRPHRSPLEFVDGISRLVASRATAHVPDLALHEVHCREVDPYIRALVDKAGIRTALLVPLLKDDKVIGMITIGRTRVRPFTDKQIELITDFAAQAAIALEITRRERQYREVQNETPPASAGEPGSPFVFVSERGRPVIGCWLCPHDRARRSGGQPPANLTLEPRLLRSGDRKLKQRTVRLVPGRPNPPTVFFDDRLADR
jgi:transcriptional regulator with GAF, ATPase, and Fis domain